MDDEQLAALMAGAGSYSDLYDAPPATAVSVDHDDDAVAVDVDDDIGTSSATDTTPPPPPPRRHAKRSKKKKRGKAKRERRRKKRHLRDADADADSDGGSHGGTKRKHERDVKIKSSHKRPSERALKRARLLAESEPGGGGGGGGAGYGSVDDEWPSIEPVAPASSPDDDDGAGFNDDDDVFNDEDISLEDLLAADTAGAISAASRVPKKRGGKHKHKGQRRILSDWVDDEAGGGGSGAAASSSADDDDDDGASKSSTLDAEAADAEVKTDARTMIVRAQCLLSIRPPAALFQVGRKRSSDLTTTLVGDLVRDISCPLHLFSVRVRPANAAEGYAGSLELLDVERVVEGPAVTAEKAAQQKAELEDSSMVAAAVPSVTILQLKVAIAKSGYFRSSLKAQNSVGKERSKYIAGCLAPLVRAMSGSLRAPLTEDALEAVAPADGDSQLSWACRNALCTRKFFDCANIVGGSAARSIGVNESSDIKVARSWEILRGGGLEDFPTGVHRRVSQAEEREGLT